MDRARTMLQLLALGACLSLCATRGTPDVQGRARHTTTAAPAVNNGGGYTVSFMPLFMLLAKFLPRLLGRFDNIQPANSRSDPPTPVIKSRRTSSKIIEEAIMGKSSRTDTEGSRMVQDGYIQQRGSFCSPQHLGRWRDLGNCRQYYECEMSTRAADGCQSLVSGNSVQEMDRGGNVLEGSRAGQKLETINSPCVTMTVYKCPRKFYYDDASQGCEPIDTSRQATICYGT
ncbi:uncharacterized protein LOC134546218 [Bacillus rossius redtenbacheri]|uniref:uncharacterized protein LOC134546218 n=1 Tax=Bacillus rossius redtenbacheri TaxID=93214 RepID=UPI002FDDE0BA